jgi:hypothetical protein
MALFDGVKKILKMCGHAFTLTVHDRLDLLETMEQRHAETDNVLLRASIRLAEQVRRSGRYEVLASEDPKNFHPALALARYLYSIFPWHGATVIGCHSLGGSSGDAGWSTELSAMGYALERVDAGSEALAIMRICGSLETGLGELGNLRPAVVIADLEAASEDRVKAMRTLGYGWHLVLEQPFQAGEAAKFYANYPVILPGWHGDVMFFRDHGTFLYALHWCEAVLRQVYFGPTEESD